MGKSTKNIHENLLRKCCKNDRNAQFEIYQLYFKSMYNTCLRILNNSTEAEDVMQESFLVAFRQIRNYKGEGSFGGWLRKIVVNHSIDALKKRKDWVMLTNDIPEVWNDPMDNAPQYEHQLDEIKKALHELPDQHRMILSLYLFEGYDHDEIGQILCITNGSSRTRYSRARQKLLSLLSVRLAKNAFLSN